MDWLDLLAVQGTLKGLFQHHSSKASILWHSAFFIVQLSHPYMTTEKNIALTRWIFVGRVISLLFNMLSRLVIAFLSRSKCLLISWLQSLSAVILKAPNKVCHCFHCFPIYLPWSGGTRCHDLKFSECWVLSQVFHSLLSFSSRGSLVLLHFLGSSAYLRLLIFLPAILIPACASSSPAFLMMCSAYKLNKQGDNIQPWCTPLPIWKVCCSMSSSNCCFLTCIHISQEASQVVWDCHLFKNFPQFIVIQSKALA